MSTGVEMNQHAGQKWFPIHSEQKLGWISGLTCYAPFYITSVQFSHSVMSDSLQPHEPQHARPPCPSLTPGVYPNSYPLSQWCHPTISSYVIPFSSCPQSFPSWGSFQMSQLFSSGGQNIRVSASASVFQWIFRTDLLQDGLVGSPCSPRDSQESSLTQ